MRQLPHFLLAAALAAPALAPLPAHAQDVAIGWSARTGDVTVDARLGDINVWGRADRSGFVEDVVVSFGAPRGYVDDLYGRGWAPGDIWWACALAQQLRLACSEVVGRYERDPGRGWGAVAQALGIRPGSPEFHALKGQADRGAERGRGRGQQQGPGRGGAEGRGRDSGQGNGRGRGNGNGNGRGG